MGAIDYPKIPLEGIAKGSENARVYASKPNQTEQAKETRIRFMSSGKMLRKNS